MEYRTRSVRLDDEVWAAVQRHELSANKLLRLMLGLDEMTIAANTSGGQQVYYAPKDDGVRLTTKPTSKRFSRTGRKPIPKPKDR